MVKLEVNKKQSLRIYNNKSTIIYGIMYKILTRLHASMPFLVYSFTLNECLINIKLVGTYTT